MVCHVCAATCVQIQEVLREQLTRKHDGHKKLYDPLEQKSEKRAPYHTRTCHVYTHMHTTHTHTSVMVECHTRRVAHTNARAPLAAHDHASACGDGRAQ